ncbi:hypothetical protein [uncultured Clostridium sp.]|uniref:hypothetical protein n=1 Tax=uncultured Clostridium sp. TaxID=59620 RepID=UPI0028E3207C|nr:hypothetical protein [uncultured Clostridium sp.]
MKMIDIKDVAESMTDVQFNKRFKKEIQGVRDIQTNRLYFCPNDLGFKLSDDNCYKGLICKKCWEYCINKLESNRKRAGKEK